MKHILPASEIKRLRQRYHLTQIEFAALTGIGTASLSRWENGRLVQNPALDQLLYLLRFPENVERLRKRLSNGRTVGRKPYPGEPQ